MLDRSSSRTAGAEGSTGIDPDLRRNSSSKPLLNALKETLPDDSNSGGTAGG